MKQKDAQAWACIQSGKRGRRQKGDVHRFEKNRSLSFHPYLEEVPGQGAVPGS